MAISGLGLMPRYSYASAGRPGLLLGSVSTSANLVSSSRTMRLIDDSLIFTDLRIDVHLNVNQTASTYGYRMCGGPSFTRFGAGWFNHE